MEDIKQSPKSLSSLVTEMNKGKKYNFDLPIQRRAGIWSPKEKSLFIDTLLRDYPVYPALVNRHSDTGKLDVVDFKQRFTTIKAFANDEFRLSKDLDPIVIDGVEYEIACKKFSKLDEVVQDKFNSRDISIITMTDATEEEIAEIFDRINLGHTLTNSQRRTKMQSTDLRDVIYNLASHPFFEKVLTKAQYKKNVDRDTVIQVLMLTEKSDQYDFGSFRNADMNKFIEYYNEKISTPEGKENSDKKIENVKKALDRLDEEFDDDIKIKQLTLPFVIYGMYRMYKDAKSTAKYVEWLKNFLETYDSNTEYLQYCSSGTSNGDMVNGRLQIFRNAIRGM